MLYSMTGHGQATLESGGVTVQVELRSVNNRYLKVVSRVSDSLSAWEPSVETILRSKIKRGSVQVAVHVRRPAGEQDGLLHEDVLERYLSQAMRVLGKLGLPLSIDPGPFMVLPGVVDSGALQEVDEALVLQATRCLEEAADQLNSMRMREGASMGLQLRSTIEQLRGLAEHIAQRAPTVIADYQQRLESKVRKMMANLGVECTSIDILREVQVYADRVDICEELVRLQSHFDQFVSACEHVESQGRKLDFLIQEIFREINTIGSKGNDATITQSIVAMKTLVEQMRELVQNIE